MKKTLIIFLSLVFSIHIFAYQENTTRLGIFYNGGFTLTTGDFDYHSAVGINLSTSLYARVSHSFTNFFALELGSGIAALPVGSTKIGRAHV